MSSESAPFSADCISATHLANAKWATGRRLLSALISEGLLSCFALAQSDPRVPANPVTLFPGTPDAGPALPGTLRWLALPLAPRQVLEPTFGAPHDAEPARCATTPPIEYSDSPGTSPPPGYTPTAHGPTAYLAGICAAAVDASTDALLVAVAADILDSTFPAGFPVRSVDPDDLLPIGGAFHRGQLITSPVDIYRLAAPHIRADDDATIFPDDIHQLILNELESSVRNQAMALAWRDVHALAAPTPGDPPIAWEKAIIEGHATHPMHRTRFGLDDQQAIQWAAELGGLVDIAFIEVPHEAVVEYGNFSQVFAEWLPPASDPATKKVVPIHPGQWPNIAARFADAILLDRPPAPEHRAMAQTSLRSVALSGPGAPAFHLKFALGVQTTSALRTVSPFSVFNGIVFAEVALRIAPASLIVVPESISIGSAHPDPTVARHMACLARPDPLSLCPAGSNTIVCASLVERGPDGVPNVLRAFHLTDAPAARRLDFFRQYVHLFLDSFLPPLRDHGFGFEAHGQNTMLRVQRTGDTTDADGQPAWWPAGFVVRDFGGVKVHLDTVRATTGIDIRLKPGSMTEAFTLEEAYIKFFHTGIQHHIHRLLRALDLHRADDAWQIVRDRIIHHFPQISLPGGQSTASQQPASSCLAQAWFAPTIPFKCLLRMRQEDYVSDDILRHVPNPLVWKLYTPLDIEQSLALNGAAPSLPHLSSH
ncbi:hypothetical protein H696_05850 [Fonticula alba]|uniref:Aerobactin siderophore biosynthesis IucA/IucC N-terminal domain-containing protein n=1 Tax=Fonticula alba TaxID=691883 RepID=A0A058Z0S2_FONAL|nr:hypothetical protein H696_05850 [Fonticula alba]KCV67741.1 hypothetical protein H696_05850 [Fonticula alba]|eukprot:XP_009497925.1 hypothetical protein H696_05850 [Fonticula alba]